MSSASDHAAGTGTCASTVGDRPAVEIIPVKGRRMLRLFINLPATLYREVETYEPPLHIDRAMLLDPQRNAFCRRGIVQYWLAFRNKRPVGRISAQISQDRPVGVPENTGMFGCLDAIDDHAVIAALVEAAEGWLRAQGCTGAFGPNILDMYGEPGLLVGGFERPPLTMTPWHPPYLQAHIEALGYSKWKDVHYWGLDLKQADGGRLRQTRRIGHRLKGLRVRAITWRSLRQEMPLLRDLFNDAWSNNWGHRPLTLHDMQGLKVVGPFLQPQAGRVIELDGEPVAIQIIVPNMYELTHGLGPHPSPIGWLRFAWRAFRFRPKSSVGVLLGISTRLHSSAASGAIALKLLDEGIASQKAMGVEWIEVGWVIEDNTRLAKLLSLFGAEITRGYRVYRKQLG